MAEVLDDRQLRHIKNAVLLREETQTTYLDHGLAVPTDAPARWIPCRSP
ncbi:MAG: hypothetical protein ACLRPT_08585 [Akkermansia muciniphila]